MLRSKRGHGLNGRYKVNRLKRPHPLYKEAHTKVKGVGRSAPKEEGGGNLRFMAGSTQHNGVNNSDFLPTLPLTGSRRRTHAFHSEEEEGLASPGLLRSFYPEEASFITIFGYLYFCL